MSPERWARIEPVLERAMELPEEERAAYLDEACNDDPALRADVERLLAADGEADELLPQGAVNFAGTLLASPEEDARKPDTAPTRLGPYRLDERIGSGGMGHVYLGHREDGGFSQTVAVKLMRRGLGDRSSLLRFQSERQILATFDHQGIARVFDGGVTEEGTPYLVMEHVPGLPLTQYCQGKQLDLYARLELFDQVCSAVEYAHQRLIVHRDLKPSNILVTEEGQAKLLDFGIAKLLAPDAAGVEEVALTRTGLIAMTPEYAAPEQLRGEPITTATDVYALGVLLYELLVGQRPYRLQGKTPSEIERIICEEEPTRPSTAVTSAEAGSEATAAERRSRRLRGDLDTIVLKALRKEPARRYRSVADLAEDLDRFRKGLPVLARPATARYRLGKFVGRHRWAVVAAVLVVVLLSGLLVALVRQRNAAVEERNRAELEASKSERVVEFLLGLFSAGDPAESRGEEITARQLVERGRERADEMADQPLVQAQMLFVIGRVYGSLSDHEPATEVLQRAVEIQEAELGPDHETVAETRDLLGNVLRGASDFEGAEVVLRANLEARRRRLGEEHVDVMESLSSLGLLFVEKGTREDALPPLEQAVAIGRRVLPGDDLKLADVLKNLAAALSSHGRHDDAVEHHVQALAIYRRALGEPHAKVANSLNDLGNALAGGGRYEEARPFLEEALAMKRQVFGDDSSNVAQALNDFAATLDRQGDYRAAATAFGEALTAYRSLLGSEHLAIAIVAANFSQALRLDGRWDEAEALGRESLAVADANLGEENRHSARARIELGAVLQARGDLEAAEREYRRAVAINRGLYGENHVQISIVGLELGRLLVETGRAAEAERLLTEAYENLREKVGDEHPKTARTKAWLAASRAAMGRADEALRMLDEALSVQQGRLPKDHPHLLDTKGLRDQVVPVGN